MAEKKGVAYEIIWVIWLCLTYYIRTELVILKNMHSYMRMHTLKSAISKLSN